MLKLDHIMLRTNDMRASISFYLMVMRMDLVAVDNRLTGDNCYLSAFVKCPESGMQIELVENIPCEEYSPGEVVDHIAFKTSMSIAILDRASRHGYKISQPIEHPANGTVYLISSIISPEGIKIVLTEKVENND